MLQRRLRGGAVIFELVLLAAHRARTIAKGSAATVEPTNDKNTVIALREIAEKAIPANDMREGFIYSLQGNAEVDEPEAAAAPALPPQFALPRLGRDNPTLDAKIDVMTEDALLRAMKSQIPQEPNPAGDKSSLIMARIADETCKRHDVDATGDRALASPELLKLNR